METITKEEFYTNDIAKRDVVPGFTECAWFRQGHALGVLLLDNDGRYGVVALSKDEGGQYRGVDLIVDCVTRKAAVGALMKMLDRFGPMEVVKQGPAAETPEAMFDRLPSDVQAAMHVENWAVEQAAKGRAHLASSVIQVEGKYMAVIHEISEDPRTTVVRDLDAPVLGPFDTMDKAKEQGSAVLTFIKEKLKEKGFVVRRTLS